MNLKKKETIKVFVLLFIFGYIIFNWNDVSWIFNYKEVYGLTYDFFNPYISQNQNGVLISNITIANTNIAPNINYVKITSLQIPTIGLLTPVVLAESTSEAMIVKALDQGVVYYPGSVSPKENGQIIILGHSAPPNWPRVKYDWVFSNLNDLVKEDEIILYSGDDKYIYKVKNKEILQKGQEIKSTELTGKNNILTLVSCWPPGKDYQRITVTAELVRS